MNRVLLDQGISRTAAKILRETGWDALHTGDIGLSRAADQEILTYARLEKGWSLLWMPIFMLFWQCKTQSRLQWYEFGMKG